MKGPALDSLLCERFQESGRRTGPFLFPDGLAYVVPHAGPAYLRDGRRGGLSLESNGSARSEL
ncbi:MAG: hypothetical protein WDO73_13730 [Ignavibacteriota bacterium]